MDSWHWQRVDKWKLVIESSSLKKLDEASKSELYENFMIQLLNTEYPLDVLFDYQFNRIQSNGMDIFDTDIDLKAYPELLPTGENGMRDARAQNHSTGIRQESPTEYQYKTPFEY